MLSFRPLNKLAHIRLVWKYIFFKLTSIFPSAYLGNPPQKILQTTPLFCGISFCLHTDTKLRWLNTKVLGIQHKDDNKMLHLQTDQFSLLAVLFQQSVSKYHCPWRSLNMLSLRGIFYFNIFFYV